MPTPNESQPTPRKWRYSRDKDDGVYVPHSFVHGPVVTVHCAGGNLDAAEPDMLLIAAAPSLLEALEIARHIIYSQVPCLDTKFNSGMQKISAAIQSTKQP